VRKIVNGVDKEGNLYLSSDVSVMHGKRHILDLGSGMDAVIKFYRIAEAGIPGAIETEFMFNLNVLVKLSGESLLKMIENHYPEEIQIARGRIKPKEIYKIDCFDIS